MTARVASAIDCLETFHASTLFACSSNCFLIAFTCWSFACFAASTSFASSVAFVSPVSFVASVVSARLLGPSLFGERRRVLLEVRFRVVHEVLGGGEELEYHGLGDTRVVGDRRCEGRVPSREERRERDLERVVLK